MWIRPLGVSAFAAALLALLSPTVRAWVRTPASPPAATHTCPTEMVLAEGSYCPAPTQVCRTYTAEKNARAHDRCAEYFPTGHCYGERSPMSFCIDRYEWPNRRGERPMVMVRWDEAKALCEKAGKRLCTEREWTFACEGEASLPYPYGYLRSPEACNIDKPYIVPVSERLRDLSTRDKELARIDQREPSGARPSCMSPVGALDMTGNVDEWVHLENARVPNRSGLKGGYWGPVRSRCRPVTKDHNEWHYGYQVGFRCCKDAEALR